MSEDPNRVHQGQEHGTSAFAEHLAECAECDADAVARVAQVLATSLPAIDAQALSQRALFAIRPELALRLRPPYWQRVAAALLGSLIPLPLVLAANALMLAMLHTVLNAVGLPSVADYMVLSYAMSLVFLLGATYAAIPVLVERSGGAGLMPLA